ncbi:MAG TPA: DUF1223 domain-containing protein [Thermoanaerobaculia bacterium]|nr:DUF1223 domain-containing protein [Thermoanaerobaculia bacterium]
MLSVLAAAVVVELFTSQGCSSCPPAERLLSELAKHPANVIALSFHVDYWDQLGWRDPFSSRAWTQRQMLYVRSMRLNSAYTPQMVVDGKWQFVGSDDAALRRGVTEASRRAPAGSVSVQATRAPAAITATVQADAPPDADLVLVVFENGVTVHIAAGENEGLTQTNDAIVRTLMPVSPGTVTIPVDPSWKHLGVAVLLQDRKTHEIVNAAVVRPSP